jgi:hypothetical protein
MVTNISRSLLFPELSYKICGFCFDVHNRIGRFRSERLYADALEAAFKESQLLYEREKALEEDYYQMKRYLDVAKLERGIIVNFRQEFLTPRRVLSSPHSEHSDTLGD